MLTATHFSCIDVYGAFSRRLNLGRRAARTHGGEYQTRCPFCGGKDRFCCWPDRHQVEESAIHYWCRGCGAHGDVVKFIQEVEGLSFADACAALNISLDDMPVGSSPWRAYRRVEEDRAPSDAWQARALEFAQRCKDLLWHPQSESGHAALAYLRKRGLSDATIQLAGIGYNSATRFEEKAPWGLDDDGKKLWIPRGIVIPWQIEGKLWALTIRRPRSDISAERPAKYVQVKGSSAGIYGIDALVANVNKPALIVEGEFDALIAQQFAGELCTPLATGGVAKGRGKRWALWIAQAPIVLIAYDADAGGQGETAAKDYWLAHIPHALPWQPWEHDITDMYHAGLDIREWLSLGIAIASQEYRKPAPAIHIAPPEEASRHRDTSSGAVPSGPCLLCGELAPRYYWHGRAGRWCCADCDDLYTWAHDEYARLKKIERRQAWI